MNIQAPLRLEQSARPLEGRVSLVTGSTSGIGLGIARALAGAGSAVVLNGFGKPEDIAETQARLVSEFGAKVHYSPADMPRRTREQRRHSACGTAGAISSREVERDPGHQPLVGVPYHTCSASFDAKE